jgi:hypothetical protein
MARYPFTDLRKALSKNKKWNGNASNSRKPKPYYFDQVGQHEVVLGRRILQKLTAIRRNK